MTFSKNSYEPCEFEFHETINKNGEIKAGNKDQLVGTKNLLKISEKGVVLFNKL